MPTATSVENWTAGTGWSGDINSGADGGVSGALNSVATGGAGVRIADLDTTTGARTGHTAGSVWLDLASIAATGTGWSIELRLKDGSNYADGPTVTWQGSPMASGTSVKRGEATGRIPGRGVYGLYLRHSFGVATAASGNTGKLRTFSSGSDSTY